MSTNAFTCLASARLAAQSRVYPNSCCPDKDLVVLFSRLGGMDRMSLWNINQGNRKWEIDIGDGNQSSVAVAMTWSPDGQSIAVALDPPGISVHSIQDGHKTQVLKVNQSDTTSKLASIWWFSDENLDATSNIPDIFKRNQIITGSAHSVLKTLPLLDHLHDQNETSMTATDVFAFQGSRNRANKSSGLPDVIEKWPTLASDHITASIGTAAYSKSTIEKAELDAMDTLTSKTILMAMDVQGNLLSFLDGAFPLGVAPIGAQCYFEELSKHPSKYLFVGQPLFQVDTSSQHCLAPVIIRMPLLSTRKARDLANLSSTARELTWYTMRVIQEMREAWFGSETQTGARELGPKWIRGLEAKQKEFSAEEDYDPILDLTSLLTTGRCSEALTDFLGSGQDMSDRGLQKWDSTLIEALVKLRDFSDKRCATAFQRLFLVLDELSGWAEMPQFSVFDLSREDLHAARNLVGLGIIISSWLANEARKELTRYREFGYWLHFEVNNIVSPTELNTPRHDILEVNHYIRSGLLHNPLDRWFAGPRVDVEAYQSLLPEFKSVTLSQVIAQAHGALADPAQTAWQLTAAENELDHLGRNLEVLVQELGDRCQRIFRHASEAASRSVVVLSDPTLKAPSGLDKDVEQPVKFRFRERTALSEEGDYLQNLIAHLPTGDEAARMLLVQLRVSIEATDTSTSIGIAILETHIPEEESEEGIGLDILDAQFFDDESMVIVYRLPAGEMFIGMVEYNEVEYHSLPYDDYVKTTMREGLIEQSLELWKSGEVVSTKLPVNRRRLLSDWQREGVTVALNGRIGRRVACVLDSTGTRLESFDMEGDAEDMEVADE